MAIFASTIKSRLIQARTITARTIQVATDKICRYFFNFNGDGFITTDRRWNPDAADPSFIIEFYNNIGTPTEALIIGQNGGATGSERELSVFTLSNKNVVIYLGATSRQFTYSTEFDTIGMWQIIYNSSASTLALYKDDLLLQTLSSVSVGAYRNPSKPLTISGDPQNAARYETGVMANVRFYINGSTKLAADLVLDMPINDNSNSIKDYSTLALDGVLTPGTGSWAEVCEGDPENLTFGSDNLTFGTDNLTF